jgi:hypothetical protein
MFVHLPIAGVTSVAALAIFVTNASAADVAGVPRIVDGDTVEIGSTKMCRRRRLFLLTLFKDKANPHGQAVNPDEFTAAEGSPGGWKDQEEFLDLKDVCRSFNFEPGSSGGNVAQQTLSSPRPIDSHYVYGLAEMFKSNTIGFSVSVCHRYCAAAVGNEPEASRKAAKEESVSPASPRVTASW